LILCETDWLQIYVQLFGFANFFSRENVGKFEVAGGNDRMTAKGRVSVKLGIQSTNVQFSTKVQ